MTVHRHRYAARLNSFRSGGDVNDALTRMAQIPGLAAAELNYPEHFLEGPHGPNGAPVDHARSLGFDVSALNLRYDPRVFRLGALTNPDADRRDEARDVTRVAVDLAARLGIPHVILWMGPDGYDYPFQADYTQLWDWEIAGFRDVALRQPGVRVSVECKPSEPRPFSLIRSMGEAMLAVHEVDLPNFGVTLDFCHSLMAGESPAAAASLALRSKKLFGIHLNDGYGPADNGLLVGSVHFQQTLELLWTARQYEFRAPIYFDTFPTRADPVAECAANIAEVERMERLLDGIDVVALRAAQAMQDALAATAIVRGALAS